MNEQNKKVPTVRFKGFTNDWEVRKLKDVLDISKTKNKAQQYGKADVLSVSREVGTVNQIKYKGRSFAGSDLSNYKVVQGGELIYTKSPLKGAPYGIFQVATIKGILSPLYAVYTSTDKAYAPFVAMALKNDNIATHYLTPLVTKGAKNTINVTDEGALEGKIQFPSILEQKQIFIFFKQLDDTIVLQQRKLALLKQLKKGFLQRMFAEKNSKRPILRFKGFHDDWEQRKLGTYIIEYKKKTTKNNEYPVLTSSRKGIFFQKDYYDGHQVASKDNVGYNIVPYGYFTYRHMSDDNLFKFNINTLCKFGIVSTLYPVFTLNTSADKYFVYYYLNYGKEMQKFALIQKQGGSRTYMYLNKLRKLRFIVPLLSEQEKISTTLLLLDKLISLQHQKLAKYQSVKKSLLQQMFI